MFARLMRLLVRWLRRRRHAEAPARILALELELGIVENTARHRAQLWRLQGRHRLPSYMFERGPGQRCPKCGYMAADVPVSAMGPLPAVLLKPGPGLRTLEEW